MRVAGAQLGPIARDERRADVVERLIALLRAAADDGAELVAFPELALTTFFPRWVLEGDELDAFYETEMPGPESEKGWAMSRVRRWKRLISPHGVRHVPKSAVSRSDAASRAASFCSGVVLVTMVS